MRARVAAATAVFVLGLMTTGGVATPLVGACTGPLPTLEDAQRTADAIYLGDIVWTKPGTQAGLARTWFDLEVDRVVRGPATDVVKVRGLRGHICGDAVTATLGDRAILATGIDSFGQRLAAIWQIDDAGIVQTENGPVDSAAVLASLSAPDTSTAPSLPLSTDPDARALGLLGLFVATLVWRLRGPVRRAA